MIPGMGGLNPKKMQAIMKQMGISQEEINSERVIIEKTDGSTVIIDDPSVIRIKMNGEESYQITGKSREIIEKFSEEDIKTVMEKTNSTKEKAIESLENSNGDLAEAILSLTD
jgi:nascent polypeptide-associated complex subunit alpha